MGLYDLVNQPAADGLPLTPVMEKFFNLKVDCPLCSGLRS
jgi:hypothetical protein